MWQRTVTKNWRMKDLNKNTSILQEIVGTSQSYVTKWCILCLNKKLRITQQKDDNVLSKQTEVVSADTNTNITLHVPKLKTKKKPL